MPDPTTSQDVDDRPSMSARASMTRAEVTRIDEASLWQVRTRLERWGGQLDTLQTTPPPFGEASGDDNRESINRLKAKYQIARVLAGKGPR